MQNTESQISQIMERIGTKIKDMKTIALAHRLMKDMESKTMEEVLADHLPASGFDELSLAGQNMRDAVQCVYDGLNEQMTADQTKKHLNSMLEGLSCDQRGRWLVNLLNCAEVVGTTGLEEEPRWLDLRDADSYQPQDVRALIDMAVRATENHAGFLARQEFSVMEHLLDRLPQTVIEEQMNSGFRFSEAYAAAMYIVSRQTGAHRDVHPYQMGLLAANCVEGSRILAQVHCYKLEAKEAFLRLKGIVKQILVQSMAFVLRLGWAFVPSKVLFDLLSDMWIGNINVILVVTVGLAVISFFDYSQEQAVETVMDIWNGVKNIVQKIKGFFRSLCGVPSSEEAVMVDAREAVCCAPVAVNSITV